MDEGCFQLTFQVPLFMQQEIFPLSNEQERALVAEGVIKLTCGNYEFVAKVCAFNISMKFILCSMCVLVNTGKRLGTRLVITCGMIQIYWRDKQ